MFAKQLAKQLVQEVMRDGDCVSAPAPIVSPEERVFRWNTLKYEMMAQDERKIGAYRKAMQACVSGRIVVEIGTGALAPLALAAAELGAKRVYAIEANPRAADAARALIKERGFAEQIEVLTGFSQHVQLPEKAEVLAQELIGQVGSDEGMVPILRDAMERFCTDETIFIPKRCQTVIAPVCSTLKRPYSFSDTVRSLFGRAKKSSDRIHVWNFPSDQLIGEPQIFEDYLFPSTLALSNRFELTFSFPEPSQWSGFLLWNQILLDDGIELDTRERTAWCGVYLPFTEKPIAFGQNSTLQLQCSIDLEPAPEYSICCSVIEDRERREIGTRHF